MKIPTDAKRVFKGVIFDVYQWQQQMFDGTNETFEMLKRPDTVEVIAIQNGQILMTHQSQPNKPDFFSLFGGRVEEGEEPSAAAKRELLEESGLASDDWELLKIYRPLSKMEWSIYIYIARDCKKISEQKLDAGEKIVTVSYSFSEFFEKLISDKSWEPELALDLLKMERNPKELEAFKQKLFLPVKEKKNML